MSIPANRQRILIVTRNLPPLVGGMERLNWHMAEELSKMVDVRVVGPAGSTALAPDGVKVREAPLKPLWKFLLQARSLARREALTWRPDLVLAGSGLTAPLARSAARRCGARTAVYVHGLDVAVRHPVYRALWLPAICHMDRVIANSHATADLCRAAGVDAAHIGIVHPGVDLPENIIPLSPLSPAKGEEDPPSSTGRGSSEARENECSARRDFRQRHNLGNRPLLLSVGRLSARKGLREFVTNSLPKIVTAYPDVMLLVVGDAPNHALHAQTQTTDSIRAAATAAGVAGNLAFLGKVSDDELDSAYRAADVHVFPVREVAGDIEGFGMVAVEAAAHGLPTVAFATGGVVDAVAEGQSGHLVEAGDYQAFAVAAVRVLAAVGGLRAGCTAFARQFAWPLFGKQVLVQLSSNNLMLARARIA